MFHRLRDAFFHIRKKAGIVAEARQHDGLLLSSGSDCLNPEGCLPGSDDVGSPTATICGGRSIPQIRSGRVGGLPNAFSVWCDGTVRTADTVDSDGDRWHLDADGLFGEPRA